MTAPFRRRMLAATFILAGVAPFAGPALAGDATAAPATGDTTEPAPQAATVGEVVITARHRSEDAQKAPVAVSVLLAWGMMLLANFGVPQIVTVTLLGSAVTNLTRLGIDPLVLASGLMGAWSLSATTTPVGAAALTVARLSGVTATTVAHEWNGAFVRVGAGLVAVWMVLLSALL